MAEIELDYEILSQKYEYRDGELYCIKPGRWFGKRMGFYHKSSGYRKVKIGRQNAGEHRVIFLLCHGYVPDIVDHEDGDTLNNRIGNLREATSIQNKANSRVYKKSHTKYKGISYMKNDKLWKVVVGGEYKGIFKDELEAAKTYDKFALEKYKEFAKLNFDKENYV